MAQPLALDIADRLEIAELLTSYSWAIDSGTPESVAELFVADGEFHGLNGTVSRGREELKRFAERVRSGHPERLQHIATNLMIELADPDRATVRSYVQVLIATEGEPRVLALGSYADEVVRTPLGWRFSSRRFESWRMGAPEANA